MTEYIKNFVEGYGVHFERSKRSQEVFKKASAMWAKVDSDLQVNSGSIMMFCGAKNNGKSSLVRYLLNTYNRHQHTSPQTDNNLGINSDEKRYEGKPRNTSGSEDRFAYYIDFDPGQPEMTTPGVVSAHIVRSSARPLESPTYLNIRQHEPIVLSCVGGTNMSVNPKMYIESCRYVYTLAKRHQSEQATKHPIFINTMGYIRNVGLAMLMDLIKICAPTDLIVLNVDNDPMRTVYADLSPQTMEGTRASFYYETSHQLSTTLDYRYTVYDLQFSFVDSTSIATKNRTALQLAYFGYMPEAMYKPIMQLSPKWLVLRSISIYCVSSYPLKINIIIELLYHSWVHLVQLKRAPVKAVGCSSADQKKSEETICNIIDAVGDNELLGCAIVADIDIEKRRLALITPLSQGKLDQNVNCVIKPLSIQVPREIL